MKLSHIILIILLFLASSCSKKDDSTPNGDVTLSSRFYGTTVYFVYGYSFELGESVPSLNSGGKLFDIIPENVLEPSGNVIGAQFSVESSNQYGLLQNGQFKSLSETENFFRDYSIATDGPWKDLSDTLQAFQVYTYKTHLDNFVKFYIKDVRIIDGVQESDYVEIDIHYYIQPDGSSTFAE